MTIDEKMTILAKQEEIFKFDHFTNEDGCKLGLAIVDVAKKKNIKPAISIRLNSGYTIFQYAFDGTGLDHKTWMEKKANTVNLKQMGSMRVGLLAEKLGAKMQDWFMDPMEYSTCGGGFPIYVNGVGMIGVILVSGIDVVYDHELIIDGLCAYFDKQVSHLEHSF